MKRIKKIGNPSITAFYSPVSFFLPSLYAATTEYAKIAKFDDQGRVSHVDNCNLAGIMSYHDDYEYDSQNRITARKYYEKSGSDYPLSGRDNIVYDDTNNKYTFTHEYLNQTTGVVDYTETRTFYLDTSGRITKIVQLYYGTKTYEYTYNADGHIATYKDNVDGTDVYVEYNGSVATIKNVSDNVIRATLTYNEDWNLIHYVNGGVIKDYEYTTEEGSNIAGEWWKAFLIWQPQHNPDQFLFNN